MKDFVLVGLHNDKENSRRTIGQKKQTEKEEWKLLARNTYFHIMENKAI